MEYQAENKRSEFAEELFLSFNETMTLLKLTRPTLNNLLDKEKIRGHKVGGKWLFNKSELIEDISKL